MSLARIWSFRPHPELDFCKQLPKDPKSKNEYLDFRLDHMHLHLIRMVQVYTISFLVRASGLLFDKDEETKQRTKIVAILMVMCWVGIVLVTRFKSLLAYGAPILYAAKIYIDIQDLQQWEEKGRFNLQDFQNNLPEIIDAHRNQLEVIIYIALFGGINLPYVTLTLVPIYITGNSIYFYKMQQAIHQMEFEVDELMGGLSFTSAPRELPQIHLIVFS